MSAPTAAAAIRRALALLQAASSDSRLRGPSNGDTPLHWPLAVAAAKAHLVNALAALEAPGAAQKAPRPNGQNVLDEPGEPALRTLLCEASRRLRGWSAGAEPDGALIRRIEAAIEGGVRTQTGE